MENLSSTTRVRRSSQQVSTLVEGETIILQLESGTYFSLNEVGAVVWNALDEPRTLQELNQCVLAEYDVDAARCSNDVRALLENLLGERMIEVF